jgi:hypothetical protein
MVKEEFYAFLYPNVLSSVEIVSSQHYAVVKWMDSCVKFSHRRVFGDVIISIVPPSVDKVMSLFSIYSII